MLGERRAQNEKIDRTGMHDTSGVYSYEDDNVTIISQPTFNETLEAIREQEPNNTTILTPELALLDDAEMDDFSRERQQHPDVGRLLIERFAALRKVSHESDNIIMMGTPLKSRVAPGNNNGLVVMKNGMTVHEQRKVNPGYYEEMLDRFEYKDAPNYFHYMGATAVICSELLFTYGMDTALKQKTNTLYVPAAWGVPSVTPKAIELHGGVDPYNQYTLNTAVEMAAGDMPNLQTVYVADRKIGPGKAQIGQLKIRN